MAEVHEGRPTCQCREKVQNIFGPPSSNKLDLLVRRRHNWPGNYCCPYLINVVINSPRHVRSIRLQAISAENRIKIEYKFISILPFPLWREISNQESATKNYWRFSLIILAKLVKHNLNDQKNGQYFFAPF